LTASETLARARGIQDERIRRAAEVIQRAGLNAEQMTKAVEGIRDGAIATAGIGGFDDVYFTVSGDGTRKYLTGINFCSCPARAICYHMVEVVILLTAAQAWD
jgi:hypothetical protein